MGETRVDLQHLLEDLRDAYPGALEETILTEVIANSLDCGATQVQLRADPEHREIVIVDDGAGMSRSVLRRYHDIASSTKTRGEGIGFAGVGIKLGLLLAEEVLTETRRGTTHVATAWRLASRQRAPWNWVAPPGRVAQRGTAMSLKLRNPLSPLLDPGYLTAAVQRHFAPLLDPAFTTILAGRYPHGLFFAVNGARVAAPPALALRVPITLRIGRQRKPGAVGYLTRSLDALPEEQRGIAISSLGKVIKQGWDWLGLTPGDADRISGLIEVPALAECLTLNKADFLRSGPRGASYLLYRRALQEAVTQQLNVWGAQSEEPADAQSRRRARPVERDLQTLLVDLADEFPLLASLVERQPGGQRALPVGRPGPVAEEVQADLWQAAKTGDAPDAETLPSDTPPPSREPSAVDPVPNQPREPLPQDVALPASGRRGPKRPMRYGLSIQFETRPGDSAPGRLLESTVWINQAHPAYQRATASRSEGYHLAVTVALVLAPLAVESAQTHSFISAFLLHWGEALNEKRRRRP